MGNKAINTVEGYNLQIQGRHVQVTDPIRDYIVTKLARVERFSLHIIDAVVVIDVQKLEHRIDITLKLDHLKIRVHGVNENMYTAIDQAMDKLCGQVRKYKEKIQEHYNKERKETAMHMDVWAREEDIINEEIVAANALQEAEKYKIHKIVRKEKRPLKTLTHDEAIMKMELSGDNFLIFRSEEDQKLKVIYRMSDDNYGVIQTE